MALTPQQIAGVKAQLRAQVAAMPADKKAQALAQIDSLSPEAVESLLQQQEKGQEGKPDKPVFRMIVDKDIPSVQIAENRQAIAVLDIAPISKGHTIIIPKKPVTDAKQIPTQCFALAKKISRKITSKLQAKSTEIQTETKFNEAILNIIPSYASPVNINSPRSKSTTEDLDKIAYLLRDKPKIQKVKINSKKSSEYPPVQIKRRIP